MHDIRFIREQPEAFDRSMARRGLSGLSSSILKTDGERRIAQTAMQEIQARRNELSARVGDAKRKGENAEILMQDVAALKENLAALEIKERAIGEDLDTLLSTLPNMPLDETPDGKDEHDNVEVRRVGTPPIIANPKQHFELGEALGLMDIPTAAKLSGARFTILKGALARLERALGDFMLDVHTTEFGYTEVSPPLLVRDDVMYGTAQLPKFKEDQFLTTDGLWLIPTAEVSLTNMVREMIVEKEKLPIRVTARTACFRAEAGAAGKDMRGMLRQHQFYKVELVSITTPEDSTAEHERMTSCAESILKRLELPFRTVILCVGDMGFSARKTYDLEVWLPGQNTYREISSCSVCGDFQARRMQARYRAAGEKSTTFVHTLNGSGLAVGRALIAVMENYQQPDGSIIVPTVLRPYMGGLERIEAVKA
jgi:seryl-tRNA synthetase